MDSASNEAKGGGNAALSDTLRCIRLKGCPFRTSRLNSIGCLLLYADGPPQLVNASSKPSRCKRQSEKVDGGVPLRRFSPVVGEPGLHKLPVDPSTRSLDAGWLLLAVLCRSPFWHDWSSRMQTVVSTNAIGWSCAMQLRS